MDPPKSAVAIRLPSTANLQIDSEDRASGSSGDFRITLSQNLLNGFFTRIAVQEIVLDWCVPNVSIIAGNNTISFQEATAVPGLSPIYTATLPDGHYTAKALMDTLVVKMNAIPGRSPAYTYSIVDSTTSIGAKALKTTNSLGMIWIAGTLQSQLDLPLGFSNSPTDTLGWTESDMVCVKLLPYSYIDITSPDLTGNQSLNDATTNRLHSRNALYRWCFAWDGPAPLDAYGYSIFQGYMPFVSRRNIAFPKQIRWRGDQPIGQLQFQTYTSDGEILIGTSAGSNNAQEFEFKLCCLVSEC